MSGVRGSHTRYPSNTGVHESVTIQKALDKVPAVRKKGNKFARAAAGIGGAGLGFITADVPGAIAGYKVGTTLYDQDLNESFVKPAYDKVKGLFKKKRIVAKKQKSVNRR